MKENGVMNRLAEMLTGEGGLLRVRALIAFAFVGTVCYLFAAEQEVPGELLGLTGGAVGYYFGTRGASSATPKPKDGANTDSG